MSHNSNLEDNEIDLSELLAALWSHKLLIILFTSLSILLAGYNALTLEKKFTASAIFQIRKSDGNTGLNISGELGALASLAGLSSSALLPGISARPLPWGSSWSCRCGSRSSRPGACHSRTLRPSAVGASPQTAGDPLVAGRIWSSR